MKNRDGSDSNVKFVSESTRKAAKGQKQQKKVNSVRKKTDKNTPMPKTANRGMVSDAYKTSLAKALTNSAKGFKGLNRLSDSDIARQFSIARGMVKKTNPVAKGFAQDKKIRADKAKEKKAFSKKN